MILYDESPTGFFFRGTMSAGRSASSAPAGAMDLRPRRRAGGANLPYARTTGPAGARCGRPLAERLSERSPQQHLPGCHHHVQQAGAVSPVHLETSGRTDCYGFNGQRVRARANKAKPQCAGHGPTRPWQGAGRDAGLPPPRPLSRPTAIAALAPARAAKAAPPSTGEATHTDFHPPRASTTLLPTASPRHDGTVSG